MRRRQFLRAAATAAVLPALSGWSAASTAAISPGCEFLFFDERFPAACRMAASWFVRSRPVGVQADITPVWSELERAIGREPLHVRGVTTGSFLFCLRILAAEHARIDLGTARLDRDLTLWTLRTQPRTSYGIGHD